MFTKGSHRIKSFAYKLLAKTFTDNLRSQSIGRYTHHFASHEVHVHALLLAVSIVLNTHYEVLAFGIRSKNKPLLTSAVER